MMRTQKKGLGDSIWASRGKPSNFYNTSPSYPPNYGLQSPPSSSVISPATPQPPSLARNGGRCSPTKQIRGAAGNHTTTQPPPQSQLEFKRYIQIVRRMKWKLPFLSHAYHTAIAKPGDALWGGDTNAAEAELMFKLDFYEYYMLLERALVHLLGVFGITVSNERQWDDVGARGLTSTHSFHENVLYALERGDSPLHDALGTGEVLFSLYRAKELRNRWKYAEDPAHAKNGAAGRLQGDHQRERSGTAPLDSYDLDGIFQHVFAGFDAGFAVAQEKVARDVGVLGGGMDMMEVEEDGFDFFVEAMDWEAV